MADDAGRLDTRAREVVAAKLAAEKAEKEAKRLRAVHRELEAALWEAMEDYSGLKTLPLENDPVYGNVKITRRKNYKAGVIDKDTAVRAIQEDEQLAKALLGNSEIRAKVANELARERAKSGEPMPDGLEIIETRGLTVSIKPQGQS